MLIPEFAPSQARRPADGRISCCKLLCTLHYGLQAPFLFTPLHFPLPLPPSRASLRILSWFGGVSYVVRPVLLTWLSQILSGGVFRRREGQLCQRGFPLVLDRDWFGPCTGTATRWPDRLRVDFALVRPSPPA